MTAYRAQPDDRTVLVFYYSGHSDGEGLNLGKERVAYAELRRWLTDTRADVRLLVIDGCKSGTLVQSKGGARGPAFEITLTDQLDASGEATLTSSAADELALESKEIRGSFFTHHLVSGLRGAADVSGDGRITLAEAYRYAFDHTVADTASSGSRQHPGYNYRMAGQGELVLTEVTQPSASLELPEGFERALVILIRRDQVLAEVSAETARRLALAPGEYALRVWKGSRAYAARFALAAGQSRKVVWSDLAEVPSPSVAFKGELEPDLEGLSPEARLEYEEKYLSVRDTVTVSEGKSQSSYELGRGKYRNPITEEEFLRVVGRSADADFYQRRHGLRMKLGIGGLAIGLVGGAVGLIMSMCDRSLGDPRFAPDCVHDHSGAYVLGASGFVGVGLLWSAFFINPHPFDPPGLRRLADEYNRSLRLRLSGASAAGRAPRRPWITARPYVVGRGGGLLVGGAF